MRPVVTNVYFLMHDFSRPFTRLRLYRDTIVDLLRAEGPTASPYRPSDKFTVLTNVNLMRRGLGTTVILGSAVCAFPLLGRIITTLLTPLGATKDEELVNTLTQTDLERRKYVHDELASL